MYAVYTDEVKGLKDIFQASIKDDWDVELIILEKRAKVMAISKAPDGIISLEKRNEFQIRTIKENWGRVIIWSDIDIQFHAKCSDLINIALSGKDVVYQAEHWSKKEANVGFAAIRCNEKTLELYTSVLQYDLKSLPFSDQSAINDILSKNRIGIEWDVLPNQFYAMSHYMFNNGHPPRLM